MTTLQRRPLQGDDRRRRSGPPLRGAITDIRFVDVPPPEISAAIARGKADFGMNYALASVRDIDAGEAITVIGGVILGSNGRRNTLKEKLR